MLPECGTDEAAQGHETISVVVWFPYCEVLEEIKVRTQRVVCLILHLLYHPNHAPCPNIPLLLSGFSVNEVIRNDLHT